MRLESKNAHTYVTMSDEKSSYDKAQDQWSQYHGVAELEEPYTEQATHLN